MALRRHSAQENCFTQPLGRSVLFVDDVDELLDWLGERCTTVTATAGAATFEAGEDLKSATSAERDTVQIDTANPTIHVRLQRRVAVVSGAGSPAVRSLAMELVDWLGLHKPTQGDLWGAALRGTKDFWPWLLVLSVAMFGVNIFFGGVGLLSAIVFSTLGVLSMLVTATAMGALALSKSSAWVRSTTRLEHTERAGARRVRVAGAVTACIATGFMGYGLGLLAP